MTRPGLPGPGGTGPAGAWDPQGPAAAGLVATMLGLEPLPEEGGLFRQVWADATSTSIYYLLEGADFSALHRLRGAEVYHFYAGAPLHMLLLDDSTGEFTEPVLGMDLAGGQRPQLAVPGGLWQGSSSMGEWTLVGTTMAPPFRWEDFRLGDRHQLSRSFPGARGRIRALTR